MFYLRGNSVSATGLKAAIKTAYCASRLAPEEVAEDNPLTLERLLPCKTISSYNTQEKVRLIQDVYADLKDYNDAQDGYVEGMDDASIVVHEAAKELLRRLKRNDSSGSEDTQVDLSTAHIAHENHRLLIGHVRIRLQANSIMDLATNYMVNEVREGATVDTRNLADWITNHTDYIGQPTTAKGVDKALNKVNDLVKQKTETAEKLFDTSPRNGVIRNF